MSQYTELKPEQAVNQENPLAAGVPTDVARDGVNADQVRTADGATTTTSTTSVSLTDTANADRLVEIFDGTTSKGLTRVGADGTWTHTITVATGARSITAKALEGTQPVSPAWTFTVLADITPAITSVHEPQGAEIPDGGTTTAPSVTLTGTATANQQVEIFDNTTISKGTAAVTASGVWSHTVTELSVGAHSLTARALYGTGKSSAARVLTKAALFEFDQTPYTQSLGEQIIAEGHPLINPPAELSYRRAARGGIPPYSYTSSNHAVAVVDSSGLASISGRGTTTITARDTSGQSGSYNLTVEGGKAFFIVNPQGGNWASHYYPIADQGGRMPTIAELQAFYNLYKAEAPEGAVDKYLGWGLGWYWTSQHTGGGGGQKYAVNLSNGATGDWWNLMNLFGVGIR